MIGSVVAQVTPAATGNYTGLDTWQTTDEYGNPQGATAVGTTPTNAAGNPDGPGYGWLGGAERALTAAGLTLMGVRLYSSTTASFSSADPVFGGNSTSYGYPNDPVLFTDISGALTDDTRLNQYVGGPCHCGSQWVLLGANYITYGWHRYFEKNIARVIWGGTMTWWAYKGSIWIRRLTASMMTLGTWPTGIGFQRRKVFQRIKQCVKSQWHYFTINDGYETRFYLQMEFLWGAYKRNFTSYWY